MRSGARMLPSASLVGFGERVAAVLRRVPARVHERARDDAAAASAASPTDSRKRRRTADAKTHPDSRERQAREGQHERDQHDVEPHQSVLELRHHRRRRVAGGALPDAALDRRRRS